MNIRVLGTGSSGNAYIVENEDTKLLLDCGLPWKQLQKLSGFTMSSINGCLVTHEHKDHCKAVWDAAANGMDIYTAEKTAAVITQNRRTAPAITFDRNIHFKKVVAWHPFTIGSFSITGLPAEHDTVEPLMFLIRDTHRKHNLLYATDTQYIPYDIKGLTHLMVEANYSYDYMDSEQVRLNKRIMRTHMSIDALEQWLKTGHAWDTLSDVWLLHLSDDRSNAEEFRDRIERIVLCSVHVA